MLPKLFTQRVQNLCTVTYNLSQLCGIKECDHLAEMSPGLGNLYCKWELTHYI